MAAPLTSLALRPKAKEVKPPLVRIRTVFQRGEAPEILDVEANLDPLEILKAAGVGILVGGVALAAGWLLWDGLAAPSPIGPVQIFRGVKETPFWRNQAQRAESLLLASQAKKDDQRCADARTGLDKLERILAGFDCAADPLGCQSLENDIATLQAFINQNCG